MEYVVSEGCFHKEKKREGGGGGGAGGEKEMVMNRFKNHFTTRL